MNLLKYLILSALLLCGAGATKAQCSIVYSLGYTQSTDAGYNMTDHTGWNIVTVKGSASMSVQVQGTCPDGVRTQLQQAINTAKHQLHTTSTTTAPRPFGGGNQYGATLCASCYMSTQNTIYFYPVKGVVYNWTYGSNVFCSVGGVMNFLATYLTTVQTELAYTETRATTQAPACIIGVCTQSVVPWCTAATSPPDLYPFAAIYTGNPPFGGAGKYQEAWAICNRYIGGSGRWGCPVPGLPPVADYVADALATNVTGSYPLQPCTHTP